MKAQATVEFLLVFTATLAVMSMLAAAVLVQHEKAIGKTDDLERINSAESAARAVEAWINTGIAMEFSFHEENVSYRIEGNSFHVTHEGNVIETNGVFREDGHEPL
jgi:hypothetical protein